MRAPARAVLLLATLGAPLACDGEATPEGFRRVELRQAEGERAPGSGAVRDVVAHLRPPPAPERIVYAPAPDLRRPPGAAEWPPVAARWPGQGEEESAGAVRQDDPAGGAGEPMGEARDTAGASGSSRR